MENEENHSISKISNKENNYKFDNYGNIMADSIEDLLYDKYMKRNKPKEESNSKEISISSSSTEKKEKEDDITVSKRINLQLNDTKQGKNDSNSSKDILELINENKQSESDDKFLDSINEENENETNNNNKSNEKFINRKEGNDIYPLKAGREDENENGSNKNIKLILNVNKDGNDNINIKIDEDKNNNNKSIKYNENSDEISKESNNNRGSESTKVNSKKGNTFQELQIKKRVKNIRKIHLNNSPSKTDKKNLKILHNKDSKKIITKAEGIKDKNNYIIKLDLNLNYSKEGKKNYHNVLTNVINNCYFCTKELINNNYDRYNSNDEEEGYGDNNKNRGNYKNIIDKDRSDNLTKNKSDKFLIEKPEMHAELDLDKYYQPSNIKIRITNPYYHLFKNNKNKIFKDYQTYSLKKVHKSKSTKDMSDNNYYLKKDRNKNIDVNRLDNRKKLGPLKLKRKIETNYNTLNKYSTKNDFNFRNDNNDNTTNVNDYNYFYNKEICNALAHKSGKKCEACLCILKQKSEEKKKNLISNKKLNLINASNSRNIKNIKLIEAEYGKNNYYNKKNIWDKNNAYSSSHNKKRKAKKKNIGKRKNYSNNDSKTSSTNYANVINIEFPLLKSYFH